MGLVDLKEETSIVEDSVNLQTNSEPKALKPVPKTPYKNAYGTRTKGTHKGYA